MSVTGMSRAELAAEVARLRGDGLLHREVAARLGISRSYASALATDPDRSKELERRESYGGVCARCDGPTKSDGTSKSSPICATCAVEVAKENARWTPETIVVAIRQFADKRGRPPAAREWNATVTPGRDECFPSAWTVQRVMGSWANAIAAAGYPRPRRGVRFKPSQAKVAA